MSKSSEKTLIALREMSEISKTVSPSQLKVVDEFERAHRVATALVLIQKQFTPEVIELITTLQNAPEGFRTDKPKGYHGTELITSVRSALLQGARLTGDEFNILAGKCYLAKAFFRRQVAQFDGVTSVKFRPKKFTKEGETAWVPCQVSLRQHGTKREFDYTGDDAIGVRVNSGMLVDAIFGKAEKKAFQRVLNELLEDDVYTDDTDDIVDGEVLAAAEPPEDFAKLFELCTDVTECQATQQQIEESRPGMTADTWDSLSSARDNRIAEIKSARGELSNTTE